MEELPPYNNLLLPKHWALAIMPEAYYYHKYDPEIIALNNIFQNENQECQNFEIDKIVTPLIHHSHRFTHTGLIHYLTLAWKNNLSVVLRPDMIWFTIIMEVSDYIRNNPEDFQEYFTSQKIEIDIEDFKELDNDFKDLFQANFASQPNNFPYLIQRIFAYCSQPYFDYFDLNQEKEIAIHIQPIKTKTPALSPENSSQAEGIPHIKILGGKDEWEYLLLKISRLHRKMGECNLSSLGKYLMDCYQTVNDILFFNFESNRESKMGYLNKKDFWKDMIEIQETNYRIEIEGWIHNFYNIKSSINNLNNFPSRRQICYFPYTQNDHQYYTAYSLSYSQVQNGFLIPYYDIIFHRIEDPDLYSYLILSFEKSK